MKKALIFLPIAVLGILFAMNSGCQTDPLETCDKDDFCGKEVSACCNTDKDCYYLYEGEKYLTEEELIKALDCTTANVPGSREDLKMRLQTLQSLARNRR